MTASRIRFTFRVLPALVLILLVTGLAPVNAQEYKETYNSALEAARAQDYDGAIDLFLQAADGADTEGDAEVARSSREIVAKIEYTLGAALVKAERFDEAIAHFSNGIDHYPTYAKNYLGRASAFKRIDDMDAAVAGFVETINVANAGSDSQTARQAEEAIRGHFVFIASSALSRGGNRASSADADEAIQALTTLQEHVDADSDVFYYMAEAHKVKGEFETAIEMADRALEIHRGSRTDQAKIHYVKGEALMSLGDTNGAKTAFQNAAFGPYKNSAEHYIETLGTE